MSAYLWRYREGDIDTLLLPMGDALPEERDPLEHVPGDRWPGETTIVTWEESGQGLSPTGYEARKPTVAEIGERGGGQ